MIVTSLITMEIHMHFLDPNNKTNYRNGDCVEFKIGDMVYKGNIAGPATSPNVIDYWIVKLSDKIVGWEWDCVVIGHNFLRLLGDNKPFICDRHSHFS